MKQREHVSFDKPRRSLAYKRTACAMFFGATIAIVPLRSWADSDDPKRFIPDTLVSSTVPSNGDLNPYGIVFVQNCRRFFNCFACSFNGDSIGHRRTFTRKPNAVASNMVGCSPMKNGLSPRKSESEVRSLLPRSKTSLLVCRPVPCP
jgi:hypothetical protein